MTYYEINTIFEYIEIYCENITSSDLELLPNFTKESIRRIILICEKFEYMKYEELKDNIADKILAKQWSEICITDKLFDELWMQICMDEYTCDTLEDIFGGGDSGHDGTGHLYCLKKLNIKEYTTYAIEHACGENNLQMVKYLFKMEAPCSQCAIDTTIWNDDIDIFKYLIEEQNQKLTPCNLADARDKILKYITINNITL
jgi:hypothetical protein